MRKIMLLAAFCVSALPLSIAGPQAKQSATTTIRGYLVDRMCASMMVKKSAAKADELAAKHTRACGLEESCAASGYGIISGGKLTNLDENGNKLAHALLKRTKKEKDISVEATGSFGEDVFRTASLKEAKRDEPVKKQ